MDPHAVVAGTAGNDFGTVVDWAAGEAWRRRRPLRIVHVLEWNSGQARESGDGSYVERVWSAAAASTNAAARRARDLAPGLEVRADTLAGHPAPRLLDLAREADLVVVGHRGSGGFAGLRLGSVGLRVATHASCPVAVVRGRAAPDGPVVAAVDDTPAADQVLDTAFPAAAGRTAALIVVRAPATPVQRDAAELDRLREQLATWRQKFTEVPVEIRLIHESIAPALIEVSAEAQLVIVGSRGRGTLRGALLGSTGRQLLQHADCPVLIARPRC
jgi:nucleotide-binding universal stress UspA family protein